MKLFGLILMSVVCCSLNSCFQNIYTVMTITGNNPSAGTAGTVFIVLNGLESNSSALRLNEKFRKGVVRNSYIQPEDVGAVKGIRIVLDYSTGTGEQDYSNKRLDKASWFLEAVFLYDGARQSPQWYECNQWLNATRTKNVSLALSPTPITVSDYKVTVETGNQKDAGTHGKVYITVLGSKGNSDKIQLDHEGQSEFQRGQIDTFNIKTKDIGDVSKIRIELDSRTESHSPNWFLKEVKLVDHKGSVLWFPWNQWLTPTLDQKTISVEIPVSTIKGKH